MIDLKKRAKNKAFWVSVFSLIALIGQTFEIYTIPENLYDTINAILTTLVGLGILIDPTTPGISDKKESDGEY